MSSANPFAHLKKNIDVDGKTCQFFDLKALGFARGIYSFIRKKQIQSSKMLPSPPPLPREDDH